MQANQDLVNFAINRLRDGRTPGQVKKEIRSAHLGWHGFEISSAIAAAIKETASKEIVQIPAVDPEMSADSIELTLEKVNSENVETSKNIENQQTPAFHNISIDWPLLDVTNAWGLLTAAVIILIILTALVAVYLSL